MGMNINYLMLKMIGNVLTAIITLVFMLKIKTVVIVVYSSEKELTKLKKVTWSSLTVCY